MNNKPVAWMLADKEKEYIRSIMAVQHDFVPQGCVEIPLYTHPSEHDLGIAEAIGFEKGHKSAEAMLRQQQAEIEALKAGKIRAYDNGVEDGRKPNTNLVKELTDEEIRHIQAICHLKDVGYDNFIMRFARAILRKAKEK